MEQVYKHFSHSHNLILHQLPEGIEVSCSGCNSSGTGTVYVCWQCNFFLHEQCYRATRTLKHPSHPSHPLTLVPYPTYPSNSFYCNSCERVGAGLSYSCAECEFDLHVQCAYSISRAASFHRTHQYQELVTPGWNETQNSNMANNFPFASVPDGIPTPFTYAQDPYLPPNPVSNALYHTTSHDLAYAPPSRQNSITTAQDPPMVHNHSVSIPMGSQNPIASALYPSTAQHQPTVHNLASVSNPMSSQNPSLTVQGPPTAPSVSIHMGSQNPTASAPYLSMAQTGASLSIPTNPPNPSSSIQGTSMPQYGPSDSIPTDSQNPIATTQHPFMAQSGPSGSNPKNHQSNSIASTQDPSMPKNEPSVSIPTSSQNPVASAPYPSMAQTEPSFSIPTNPQNHSARVEAPSVPQYRPSDSIPTDSQNPVANTLYPSISQSESSVSIPINYPSISTTTAQDRSKPQNEPSVSIHTSTQNPIGTAPSFSNPPNYPLNPIPTSQDPSMPQSTPSFSIHSSTQSTQNPSIVKTTGPSVSIPQSNTTSNSQDPPIPQNGFQDKGIIHFSHPHTLSIVELQEDEENEVTCSGCEDTLVGKGYSCAKQKCDFYLHESCFHLEKEIHHKSHPEHPLILLPSAPYKNNNDEFICNACFSDGTGFTYHCSACKFDLHIQCVNLPETVSRDDHEHELKLYYSCPVKDDEYTFYCDVCHVEVEKDRWVYYCDACDYGTHLGCVDCEECEGDTLDPQAQLQMAQFQLQLARQQAQFMASLGSSLSSLAG